ncbi:MaoC family dehydratase [soil metagenome]
MHNFLVYFLFMFSIGQQYELEFSYTQEDVKAFADITSDHNPIHLDQEFAANTAYKKPIIHGFLGGAIFSRIFGTLFPGEGTIYLQQNLNFKRPMYVNVLYKAIITVKEVDPEKHNAVLVTEVVDLNSGKATISGEATILNKTKIIQP